MILLRTLVTATGVSLPYPKAGVSCVLCRSGEPREFLLVKRGNSPGKGKWSLPGGKLELGESTLEGALREIREETGLPTRALELHPAPFTSTDAIYYGTRDSSELEFHYVISQCFAWVRDDVLHGTVVAGDDATEVGWFTLDRVTAHEDAMAGNVRGVIQHAERLVNQGIIAELLQRPV